MQWEARKKIVTRVEPFAPRTYQRGLPVGVRAHDQAVDGLYRPATPNKRARQPIQQFRVRGRRASSSKVAEGLHDTVFEMMLPNAIDHDPRGQRMFWMSQPFRQGQAPASLLGPRPRRLGLEGFIATI